ncbi:MAG: hypothetical protein EP330_03370 [Deltaproteobacteria bacterium]|nr:MAG: hypothetical protein EP330_03370 [Deltaproteobacteria bacterium]
MTSRLLVVAVGCSFTTIAAAEPGDHIRLGEAVITPTLDLGIEHRTNAFQRDTRAIAGTALRVAPGLELALDGPEVAATFGGEWEIRKYIQSQASSLDRMNDFNLGGSLDLFRNRALGIELREYAALRNNTNDSGLAEDPFATQLRNEAGARVKIRFGQALQIAPGFTHLYTDFRVPEGALFNQTGRDYNTRQGLNPGLDAEWKFLPRTSIVLDTDLIVYSWEENTRPRFDQEGGALTVAIPNSTHFKLRAGLRGRVTERISSTVELGYGLASYKDDDTDLGGLEGLLVAAQAQYDMSSTQKLSIGYKKDFDDSWFTNYMTYNHLYVKHHGKYGSRLSSDAEAMIRFEGYKGGSLRSDSLLRLKLDGSVALQDWASTTLGVWYTQRGSTDSLVRYNDVNIHWLATFTY